MYAKRLQLANYGPISDLDITFPFSGDRPIPTVLVGPNGSGKSIVLSHITNALLTARDQVFPATPEVEPGKVFKLRANSYIRTNLPFFFAKVDFAEGLYYSELRTSENKESYPEPPPGIVGTDAEPLWNRLRPDSNDQLDSNLAGPNANKSQITRIFDTHAAVYFPSDRFEFPGWLNVEAVQREAQHMELLRMSGETPRQVIATSPLRANRDWLYDVVYDRAAFELQVPRVDLPLRNSPTPVPLPLFAGYSGEASNVYEAALALVRTVVGRPTANFGIGRRANLFVYLADGEDIIAPDVFQLSSGEVSLLNLALSILRDFDLSLAEFTSLNDVKGVAIVDEVDLHLHASHQHEVLPKLLTMFPRVQFILTTHSPLFVLGLSRELGEEGFSIYNLPQGSTISSESFAEFGEAYDSFSQTRTYAEDISRKIADSQRPILLPEGDTDKQYIETAAQILERGAELSEFEIWEGGGSGSLKKLWNNFTDSVARAIPQPIVLLFDCDAARGSASKGRLVQRTIPLNEGSPIATGIENLFTKATLERARSAKTAFIDVDPARTVLRRGEEEHVPETWTVNPDEKANLCRWLCENGDATDFEGFHAVFDLLQDAFPEPGEGT